MGPLMNLPQADAVCDGGDLDCGSGLLLIIRNAMAPLAAGGVLEVRSREASVREDLPAWCRMVGHGLLGVHDGEDVLLSGSYEPLLPHFARMRVDQFVLEYATPRAGALEALRSLPESASVGFGVVNPRTAEIEAPAAIAQRVRALSRILGSERIFLNPDCGFGTFAERPVASAATAFAKLRALAAAAALLRKEAPP